MQRGSGRMHPACNFNISMRPAFNLPLLPPSSLQGNLFNEMRSKTKVLQKPVTNFDPK